MGTSSYGRYFYSAIHQMIVPNVVSASAKSLYEYSERVSSNLDAGDVFEEQRHRNCVWHAWPRYSSLATVVACLGRARGSLCTRRSCSACCCLEEVAEFRALDAHQ